MPKIECVPNISEGADLDLVDDIISAVKTVKILNVHSDPDHNRTVVTFIDEPEKVKQAAFDLTERAMQLLDVNQHMGVHPFIGVVDVIPFIPVSGCTMEEARSLALALGRELWKKLKLPVYFYGEAAKIPERKELPCVRTGGYFRLKNEIDLPQRRPDLGKGLHNTAGAVAVGARDFLIAFNVNLNTPDPTIAQSIAKNIREKSGGLPGVRALGVELISRSITQVTINITDHQETSLEKVLEEVKKWAKEYRVEVIESEIVGLTPEEVQQYA